MRKVGSEKWGAGPKPPVWLHGELGEGDAVAFVNTAGSGNGLFPFSLIFNLSFFLQIFFVLQSDKPLAQCGLGHCFQRYTVLLYACVLTCANLVTIMTHDSRSQLFCKRNLFGRTARRRHLRSNSHSKRKADTILSISVGKGVYERDVARGRQSCRRQQQPCRRH